MRITANATSSAPRLNAGRFAPRVEVLAVVVPAAFLLLLLVVKGAPVASPTKEIVGVARTIDGDTIEVGSSRIRLQGIDAPEASQLCMLGGENYPCGNEATRYLTVLLGREEVHCAPTGHDRWGRILARCTVNGRDANAEMVRNGWAVAYRRYSDAYVNEETLAKSAAVGIWRGDFANPETWRHDRSKGGTDVR